VGLNVLKHLSTRHAIRLVCLDGDPDVTRQYPGLESYCTKVNAIAMPEYMSHRNQLITTARSSISPRKLLSEYRSFLTPLYSPVMAAAIKAAYRDEKYDVVYASSHFAFYAWKFSSRKVVHAFECVSAACQKEFALARNVRTRAYWMLAYLKNRWMERQVFPKFDNCIVVSNEEYKAFSALLPDVRYSVIPIGVDTEFFKPTPSREEEWPSLVFVGYMSHSPNVTAIEWFHSRVYDTLKKRFPDLKLFIVGQNPTEPIRSLAHDPSIVVTGFVDDVRPYVARASVSVAPFISGSGSKTKVLEAMAMGKSVVATSIGVRGINATDGDHLCVADSPAAFAERVQELLRDEEKRHRMGHRAREFVQERRSWARVTQDIDKVLSNSEISVRGDA